MSANRLADVAHVITFAVRFAVPPFLRLIDREDEMKRGCLVWIALAAAVAVGCNRSSETTTNRGSESGAVGTSGADRNQVSARDKDFVRDAAIANMAEVELGRLATERGANPEVKKFGQMMIDDHTKAGDQLKSVASQHNIEVPNQLDDKHNKLRDKLSKLQGADFDREYMDAMVDGHEDVAGKLESRVDKAKLEEWRAQSADRTAGRKVEEHGQTTAILPEKSDNPVTMSINQWAADTYPTVIAHRDAAKALDNAVKQRTTY
jgi:putative membrane protein